MLDGVYRHQFVKGCFIVGDDGAEDWLNVSEIFVRVICHAAAKKFETVSTGKKPLLYCTSASRTSFRHFQSPVWFLIRSIVVIAIGFPLGTGTATNAIIFNMISCMAGQSPSFGIALIARVVGQRAMISRPSHAFILLNRNLRSLPSPSVRMISLGIAIPC